MQPVKWLTLSAGLMIGIEAWGTQPLAAARSSSTVELDKLVAYANGHRQDPVEYVVQKFQTHDIIFLGEFHFIKHDAEFVQRLMPALYAEGVYNLGIEFACHGDQQLVDQLLTAPSYDEDLARRIMFRNYVLGGYKEYLDLYRAAWSLNTHLAPGKPRFRIVALNARADWSQLTTPNQDRSEMRKVWSEGYSDPVMGRVILTEFVGKGQKALIYMGAHHAQTRYDERPPRARFALPARAGHIVYEKIRDRAFTIRLHGPWPQRNGPGYALPVAGVIDAVFSHAHAYPTGFDTRGTPFGLLADRECRYAQGRDRFVLQDLCDGYIFQKPLSEYEMMTVDQTFIHAGNLREAIAQLPDPEERKKCHTVADVQALIREQAEYGYRWTQKLK
jgi:hypothetical protein